MFCTFIHVVRKSHFFNLLKTVIYRPIKVRDDQPEQNVINPRTGQLISGTKDQWRSGVLHSDRPVRMIRNDERWLVDNDCTEIIWWFFSLWYAGLISLQHGIHLPPVTRARLSPNFSTVSSTHSSNVPPCALWRMRLWHFCKADK